MTSAALERAGADESATRSCPVPEDVTSTRHLAVLQHLREETSATVGELAAVVADQESPPQYRDDQSRVELAVTLHEEVLPTLAATGLVEYEPADATVTLAFLSTAVADWLDGTDRTPDR